MAAPKILLVEDNWVESLTLGVFLEDHNMQVVAKLDKAEEIIKHMDACEIILLDINLSGKMTGLEAAEKLRMEGYEQPIIFLTAMGDQSTIDRIAKIRTSKQMLKPFDFDELLEEINDYFPH
jgi:DNA-binding response OmpR family regulator